MQIRTGGSQNWRNLLTAKMLYKFERHLTPAASKSLCIQLVVDGVEWIQTLEYRFWLHYCIPGAAPQLQVTANSNMLAYPY